MRKYLGTMCAALAATASSPALADAPKGSWVELQAGWDRVSLDFGDLGLGSYSENGVNFGIATGYDFPVSDTASLGIETEIADSTTKYVYDDAFNHLTISTGRDLYIGTRLTVAASEKLNIYGKVGYTNTRIKISLNGLSDAANGDGLRVGLGAQLSVTEKTYASLEYRHSNYEADLSRNQVLVGYGIRF